MPIENMYSIYDHKSLAYSNPFYAVNDFVAFRSVGHAMFDPNCALSLNPEDFTLFHVATFDTDKCLIEAIEPMRSLGNLCSIPLPSGVNYGVSSDCEKTDNT